MSRPRLPLLAAAVAALVLASSAPASAASLEPPRTVAAPACAARPSDPDGPGGGKSDVAYGAGALRGFTSFQNPSCDDAVYYVQGGSQGWRRTLSPYRGLPLAVAVDEVSTYLLFFTYTPQGGLDRIWVTKRDHTGRFYPATALSSPIGAVVPSGDVGAHGGKWWAVWSEQVGPGGEFAHSQLFSARTYGTAQGRTQLTSTAADLSDSEPSISVDGDGMVLAWQRQAQTQQGGPTDLWVATSTDGTLRGARAFATQGKDNYTPDVLRRGATFLAWVRDGKIVEADNSTGSFRSHEFSVGGQGPRIGATNGSSYVTWQAGLDTTDASYYVYAARGSKGSAAFTGGQVSPVGHVLESAVAVNGRLTVVERKGAVVRSRTGTL
ncbi:MAG: hypothetical protein JWO60_2441 [Frankiales bacterium]|nr:hypothetical protein [Frankiales bacterium]